MAKKIVQQIQENTSVEVSETPELTNVAFSIIKTGDKKFSVVKVGLNLDAKVAGNVEIVAKDLDIYEAQHEFKIATVKAGFFN